MVKVTELVSTRDFRSPDLDISVPGHRVPNKTSSRDWENQQVGSRVTSQS